MSNIRIMFWSPEISEVRILPQQKIGDEQKPDVDALFIFYYTYRVQMMSPGIKGL